MTGQAEPVSNSFDGSIVAYVANLEAFTVIGMGYICWRNDIANLELRLHLLLLSLCWLLGVLVTYLVTRCNKNRHHDGNIILAGIPNMVYWCVTDEWRRGAIPLLVCHRRGGRKSYGATRN